METTTSARQGSPYTLAMRPTIGKYPSAWCIRNQATISSPLPAVILDCSRYLNRVLDINIDEQSALVEPGIVCDSLKSAAEEFGLTFGPDPATHSRCTLGGMIGNNSCGPRSMLAGKTVENVLELEVLTSDGSRFWTGPTSEAEIERIIKQDDRQGRLYAELRSIRDKYADLIREKYPDIKRRVSGYNLDQLLPENGFNVARALVGSEGTCVSILQARLRLCRDTASLPYCHGRPGLGNRRRASRSTASPG